MVDSDTSAEKPAADSRGGWTWSRIRFLLFWAATLVIVFELAAGAIWNLVPIDWVEAQLIHLGYPPYLALILGVWQAAAAVAIIVPGFPVVKEWAYVGSFFLWSGAVTSHLILGDSPDLWGVPLMFAILAVASWALRPADRRPGGSGRVGYGRTGSGPGGTERVASRPREWAITIALLAVWSAISLVTLPSVDAAMHERAVEHGWIDEQREQN